MQLAEVTNPLLTVYAIHVAKHRQQQKGCQRLRVAILGSLFKRFATFNISHSQCVKSATALARKRQRNSKFLTASQSQWMAGSRPGRGIWLSHIKFFFLLLLLPLSLSVCVCVCPHFAAPFELFNMEKQYLVPFESLDS